MLFRSAKLKFCNLDIYKNVGATNQIYGDHMRMLGYLKNTYKCNKKDTIYKIVFHKTEKEVYVYLYTSLEAALSSFDNWFLIDDPMPYCQHDALLPIQVKGRNTNTPQWGKFEIYENGEWKDYEP